MQQSRMSPDRSRLVAGSPIEGVDLWLLNRHDDARGSFMEVFQEAWGSAITPVQWSVVASEPRVLRGVHLHWRHDEYIALLKGRACVGLRDMRPTSPTFGVWSLYDLSEHEPAALTFPSGLLHGWYFYASSLHLQAVSESYVDYHPDDNIGVRWDDPNLEIPWPDDAPIISARADGFGSVQAILDALSERLEGPVSQPD